MKARGELRQNVFSRGRTARDPELAHDLVFQRFHHLLDFKDFMHESARAWKQQTARFSEPQPAAGAVEQLDAQVALKHFDMVADGGLGEMQVRCRLRKTHVLRDMQKRLKFCQINH